MEVNPQRDLDLRGTGATFRDALDEAFKRTGVPRDQFKVTKWGRDQNRKSVPVEYSGLGGANVNMDIPQWNNVKPIWFYWGLPAPTTHWLSNSWKRKQQSSRPYFYDYIPATRR
ncbi:hypothetical protein KW548_17670 [Vibrio neptunius]|uniref:polymorphic toxin type 47 domain-containing protein n=1 Tax=Vibrio neptunius TaxID=170651 RepID=UPI001C78FD40|nr:hypothetical protein KW548_17670 [Vibrio neptunius]